MWCSYWCSVEIVERGNMCFNFWVITRCHSPIPSFNVRTVNANIIWAISKDLKQDDKRDSEVKSTSTQINKPTPTSMTMALILCNSCSTLLQQLWPTAPQSKLGYTFCLGLCIRCHHSTPPLMSFILLAIMKLNVEGPITQKFWSLEEAGTS